MKPSHIHQSTQNHHSNQYTCYYHWTFYCLSYRLRFKKFDHNRTSIFFSFLVIAPTIKNTWIFALMKTWHVKLIEDWKSFQFLYALMKVWRIEILRNVVENDVFLMSDSLSALRRNPHYTKNFQSGSLWNVFLSKTAKK